MSLSSSVPVDRKMHARSAITNGKLFAPGIDQRSAPARRFRDLVAEFTRELSNGEALSVRDQALIKQAAAIVVRIEALQAAIVLGEPVDDETLVRLSNTAHRLLAALAGGWKRKKAVPSITALIRSVEGR